MSEFKVESGVKVERRVGYVKRKYPWPDMQSGNSFEVVCANGDRTGISKSLRSTGTNFVMRNRPGWSVVVRNSDRGVRAWLFAPGEAP